MAAKKPFKRGKVVTQDTPAKRWTQAEIDAEWDSYYRSEAKAHDERTKLRGQRNMLVPDKLGSAK